MPFHNDFLRGYELWINKIVRQIKNITSKAEEELKQDIERKKKQAELKIEQAKSEALNDVKRKAAELSFQITKKYLEENIDSKTSTSIIDESISDIKKNL